MLFLDIMSLLRNPSEDLAYSERVVGWRDGAWYLRAIFDREFGRQAAFEWPSKACIVTGLDDVIRASRSSLTHALASGPSIQSRIVDCSEASPSHLRYIARSSVALLSPSSDDRCDIFNRKAPVVATTHSNSRRPNDETVRAHKTKPPKERHETRAPVDRVKALKLKRHRVSVANIEVVTMRKLDP
jgi:hypothetical protein